MPRTYKGETGRKTGRKKKIKFMRETACTNPKKV
jgi:hypothetical protein